ncbi:hypothetical protein K443DRAFT_161368 [Laccaria amethystina LaAM-08-1]|uniref:Uncharacterized protein n=1 Tax=Laccaria amethystina LaAM-08-1 TaxID=1095629 RepID=A0A0C9XUV8_9AGAR|nr:hypothetical protein K443DRAFT_161368 [Laccaria amethystina LaAM-08-1]
MNSGFGGSVSYTPLVWPKYTDTCSPPMFGTSRHLIDDDWWQYERASNPNLGSLTICTALVSKPIVDFPSRIASSSN